MRHNSDIISCFELNEDGMLSNLFLLGSESSKPFPIYSTKFTHLSVPLNCQNNIQVVVFK